MTHAYASEQTFQNEIMFLLNFMKLRAGGYADAHKISKSQKFWSDPPRNKKSQKYILTDILR
jgi:hypothetical protein